ncbi:hypothetical protein BDZ91DRAFT_772300 [Kalaharituber pfeilii]|nr:hypothetical protein BDZ91DRAFT_772300 [Kalaharituber pfeilii]
MDFEYTFSTSEAPLELQSIGKGLSKTRRENAETGSMHLLASRLSALFEGLVEETPKLCKAYGTRAGEIVSHMSAGLADKLNIYGCFADHAGIDATSIWACATLGSSALRVHMLACLIARLWPASEASAIWLELVQERIAYLRRETELYGYIATPSHDVAQTMLLQDFELSEWDRSARAWILCADRVRQHQQTQAMLLINHLNLEVDPYYSTVPQSVISVWRIAMVSMENLITGNSQQVDSGAVLLGVISWHLYPDMRVVGDKTFDLRQHDELIQPRGKIMIGESASNSKIEEAHGIYWSMVLTSLTDTGEPARIRRSTIPDTTRVNFQQLQQVAMGALLGHWGNTISAEDFSKLVISLVPTIFFEHYKD